VRSVGIGVTVGIGAAVGSALGVLVLATGVGLGAGVGLGVAVGAPAQPASAITMSKPPSDRTARKTGVRMGVIRQLPQGGRGGLASGSARSRRPEH
jgi:hypothetical protein